MTDTYIILNCPPGPIRPDTVLSNILTTTQLSINDFEVESKVFLNFYLKKKELYDMKLYTEYILLAILVPDTGIVVNLGLKNFINSKIKYFIYIYYYLYIFNNLMK